MELIDKADVVAEIEKRIEICAKQREDMLNVQCHALADDASARIGALNCIKGYINTLEVKEVDVDEAARKWEDKVYLEKGWQDQYGTPHAPFSEIGNAFREGAKFILKAQKGE